MLRRRACAASAAETVGCVASARKPGVAGRRMAAGGRGLPRVGCVCRVGCSCLPHAAMIDLHGHMRMRGAWTLIVADGGESRDKLQKEGGTEGDGETLARVPSIGDSQPTGCDPHARAGPARPAQPPASTIRTTAQLHHHIRNDDCSHINPFTSHSPAPRHHVALPTPPAHP
ncbi:hypothetical protein EDC01DRAFT_779808 [Geopyxis carbonaria]|nr:hypothetical protein EDC01DRAFT_779808 [Geopyxis carbonaria]